MCSSSGRGSRDIRSCSRSKIHRSVVRLRCTTYQICSTNNSSAVPCCKRGQNCNRIGVRVLITLVLDPALDCLSVGGDRVVSGVPVAPLGVLQEVRGTSVLSGRSCSVSSDRVKLGNGIVGSGGAKADRSVGGQLIRGEISGSRGSRLAVDRPSPRACYGSRAYNL